MARTALPGRLTWRVATLREVTDETPTARTLVFDVPGWPGHLPGQHVDVRLTAEDGYSTQRSYSIAAPADGERVVLTIQQVPDGEVSPFLTRGMPVGSQVELRGPVGGWFVWRDTDPAPVLLVAGGSGIVPLAAMLRARVAAGSRVPFRVLYSLRSPAERFYAGELRSAATGGVDITYFYTREAPPEDPRGAKRIGLADVNTHAWPADFEPSCFVCGPTGFVETVANVLIALGHDPRRVRTERFGPSGG